MKKHCLLILFVVLAIVSLSLFTNVPVFAKAHRDVWLKDAVGHKIQPNRNAAEPYSPRKTCGTCHGYSTITYGYHFQQGFTQISDNFNVEKPWLVSPGMYGKW